MNASLLKSIFRYDAALGRLYRGRQLVAGTPKWPGGPLVVSVGGKITSYARICFAIHNGYLPAQVRHRSQDQRDNSAGNLYDPSHAAKKPRAAPAAPHAGKYPGVSVVRCQRRGVFRGYQGSVYFAGLRYRTPVVETPEAARDMRAALKAWLEYAAQQKDSPQ